MTAVDSLWYLADEASQQAEQVHHRLSSRYDDFLAFSRTRSVSRSRFRTVAQRIESNGLPFGAHTLVYRENADLVLVRHSEVGMWVLPGGETDAGEDFRAAARRELGEEAGIEAAYEGLGMLGKIRFTCRDYDTWGVLPIYRARAASAGLEVADPDGEITEARWFDELPENTRDRSYLQRWRRKYIE
ncbi:NUDIX domain-containing protein [Haloarculaceae archaeon H-GB11]|nr:NUDIX domain-containing protein [Haloarculaceae archaeon H-GB11]